jgi:broad specificity phosphatase PhoE
MQYQDGETRDVNGVRYVRQGGQWTPQGSTAPSPQPLIIPGPPRQPTPRYPDEAVRGMAEAELARGRIGVLPAEQAKLRADASKAESEAALARRALAGTPPVTSEHRGKLLGQFYGAQGLSRRISELESRFEQDFSGNGLGALAEYLPGQIRPANQEFDDAGRSLMGDLAAAFGLTAQQQNTPTELEIRFGPFIPKAGDRDEVIQAKIARLKEVARQQSAQAAQQLGLEQQAPPTPAQGTPPTPERADKSTVWLGNPTTGDQRQVASGGTRMENNPALAGVNARVNAMLKKGASNRDIVGYLRGVGVEDRALMDIMPQLNKAREFRRQNPTYKGDFQVDLERWEVPSSLLERSTPEAAYFGSAADALTLGNLDSLTGNPDLTRAGLEGLRQQNPNAALAGTVSGGALAAGGLEAVAAKLGLQGARAAMAGDAAFGAGYGAGSADDGSRVLGALTGAAAGTVGGVAGRKIVGGAGRAMTGTRDAATRYLTERGVPLTIGQIAGGGGRVGAQVKRFEDTLESVPILGNAIRARREEGVLGFNTAAFKEALEPIPPNAVAAIGEEGVEQAQSAVSGAYDQALDGVIIRPDKAFARDLTRAAKSGRQLHGETAEAFEKLLENEVAPELAKGALTGTGYQTLRRIIREERAAWKADPRGRPYGKALRQLEGSLENLVRRRSPATVEALNQADAAYRGTSVIRDAVSRGKNASGVFTPAQLGMAADANAKKFGGTQGTTRRPFFELQRAGQDILPSRVPNSGTADRALAAALLPTLAGASAGGQAAGLIDPSTAGIMIALGLPFTKAGQATFQLLLVQRPDLMRAVGQQVLKRRGPGGLFGAGGGASLAAQ